MATEDELRANLDDIREDIARACARSERDVADVTLIAASKAVPIDLVRRAYEAGVGDFGENYVKELRAKHDAVPAARWHFIGTLQTNTVHHVALLADVVHTVAGGRAAERLARRVAESGRVIDVMIEVDFTGERTGVAADDARALADAMGPIEGLRLVGLMTLPPMPERPDDARPFFVRLRDLRDRIRDSHPEVVELSMGMSLDYRVAVEEGATMVRIGTALFGPRARST